MLEPRSDRSESSPERELVFTRVLDAPRHLVFAAWSSREHLPRWYGPHGFTLHFHAQLAGPDADKMVAYLQSIKHIDLPPNPFLQHHT